MNNKNRQEEVLAFIRKFIDKSGYPPTVREICSHFGFSSTSTAQYYLKKLKENGQISSGEAKNRAISLNDRSQAVFAPLVGTVAAGSPILAVQNIEGYIPLPDEFKSAEDIFLLTVSGDSMVNAGIFSGDKIIVKQTPVCENGQLVVALVDDSATCKRFYKRDGHIVLHPENDNMEDMIFDDVSILGTVVGLIRKY